MSSRNSLNPFAPATLTISCGSAITAVVPCGNTALPNSSGNTMPDSMCTCASMKPAVTISPSQSTTDTSGAEIPSPTATILPSDIRTSALWSVAFSPSATLPPFKSNSVISTSSTIIQTPREQVKRAHSFPQPRSLAAGNFIVPFCPSTVDSGSQ